MPKKSEKSHESIGPRAHRSSRVRISAGSKALKLRGIVTFWSSEQEDAMSETTGGQGSLKVQGSAEGKDSEGMNPTSGTGPRGRKVPEGANRQEGEKP